MEIICRYSEHKKYGLQPDADLAGGGGGGGGCDVRRAEGYMETPGGGGGFLNPGSDMKAG